MNKERLQELITTPDAICEADLAHLQQVIRDYPAFHNAHLLLLYGLNKQKSEKFQEQLAQSALFLTNRPFLVNAIFNGWVGMPSKKLEAEKKIISEPVAEKLNGPLIAETPTLEEEAPPRVVEFEMESTTKVADLEKSRQAEAEIEIQHEESFTLALDEAPTVESFEKKEVESSPRRDDDPDLLELDMGLANQESGQTEDLIDHFLKVNPRIVPKLDLEDSRGDISQPCLEENDEIVTETLALIFEQQGHFLKAKEAFQKLILKFPEKSTYFASRIQELEKRIK